MSRTDVIDEMVKVAVQLPVKATPTEDPWLNAQRQFDAAAEVLNLDQGVRAILREPQRQLLVNFPVKMDDGSVRVFEGPSARPPRPPRSMRGPGRGSGPGERGPS